MAKINTDTLIDAVQIKKRINDIIIKAITTEEIIERVAVARGVKQIPFFCIIPLSRYLLFLPKTNRSNVAGQTEYYISLSFCTHVIKAILAYNQPFLL